MTLLSRFAAPVAGLLDASAGVVFRLLGVRSAQENAATDEEIRSIVAKAESAGMIEGAERHMTSGVMRIGDRPVCGIMTSRTDVDWIDLAAPEKRQREALTGIQHSHLPVGEGSADALLGVVQTRELLAKVLSGQLLDVRACVRTAPVIPDTADALDALAMLRSAEVSLVLVYDEYGHFQGVVTPAKAWFKEGLHAQPG